MRSPGRQLRNEDGAALLFVVLMLVTLIGLIAIAVDVGLWLTTRSEAQRAADAAALAGAGLYREPIKPTVAEAEAEARRFAALNFVGRDMIDAGEDGDVTVLVEDAKQKVTVTITGGTHPLFAQYLGWDRLPVRATAAARVFDAGGAKCVKPFALPDTWHEKTQDANGNRVWDNGEAWTYDPQVDHYKRFGDTGPEAPAGEETGYGSAFRDGQGTPAYKGDHGRRVAIKAGEPVNKGGSSEYNTATIYAGLFFPFALPEDPTMPSCKKGGGGGEKGGAAYRRNICQCNNNTIELGKEYPLEPGNMVGPTQQGIKELLDEDPSAYWDTRADPGQVVSQYGMDSPRVIKIALYDPAEVQKSGRQAVRFNNIALFFLEGYEESTKSVIGRFIKYADGVSSSGPKTGSMIKVLQLVQ